MIKKYDFVVKISDSKDYDYRVIVDNGSGSGCSCGDLVSQIETNKQDITNLKVKDFELDSSISAINLTLETKADISILSQYATNEVVEIINDKVIVNTNTINNKKDKLNLTTDNELLTGDIVNGKPLYIKYVSGKMTSTWKSLVENAIVFDYNIMVCDIENGTYFSIDSKEWNSRSETINVYNNSINSIGINFLQNGFYKGWIKYYKV